MLVYLAFFFFRFFSFLLRFFCDFYTMPIYLMASQSNSLMRIQ